MNLDATNNNAIVPPTPERNNTGPSLTNFRLIHPSDYRFSHDSQS